MVRLGLCPNFTELYAAFVFGSPLRTGTTSKWFATNPRPNPSLHPTGYSAFPASVHG